MGSSRSRIAAEREYASMVEAMMRPPAGSKLVKKARPASAGLSRPASRPTSAGRARPATKPTADEAAERARLEAEVARLEALARRQQQEQEQQQAHTSSRASVLELQRQRQQRQQQQRYAAAEDERAHLQGLVAELGQKHDSAQVQLKRAATQLAGLRSKLRASEL